MRQLTHRAANIFGHTTSLVPTSRKRAQAGFFEVTNSLTDPGVRCRHKTADVFPAANVGTDTDTQPVRTTRSALPTKKKKINTRLTQA